MALISVVEGDITQVTADALITAVNSRGTWFGRVDRAIYHVAGTMFHDQIMQYTPLDDGHCIFAEPETPFHRGAFGAVIFVIDDLNWPLMDLVLVGLEMAVDNELQSVTIPSLRTDVRAGTQESHEEALAALADAVNFYSDSLLDQITIVVNNQADVQFLEQKLSTTT